MIYTVINPMTALSRKIDYHLRIATFRKSHKSFMCETPYQFYPVPLGMYWSFGFCLRSKILSRLFILPLFITRFEFQCEVINSETNLVVLIDALLKKIIWCFLSVSHCTIKKTTFSFRMCRRICLEDSNVSFVVFEISVEPSSYEFSKTFK